MTEVKKTPPSLTPPIGGAKKAAATTATATKAAKPVKEPKLPKVPKEPKESAGAGAPRPRKHEYGIKPDAVVKVVPEQAEAAKRAGVAVAFEHAKGDPTVEAFYAKGGDRHDLRVMSRRGLIKIVWPTGEEFPQAAAVKVLEAPKASDAATEPQTVAGSDVDNLSDTLKDVAAG